MPKETSKKQSKDKKHFGKDFKAELKKVIWPTPKQLLNSTIAVITIVLITALIVFVLDFTFEKMNEYGIEKLKTVVEKTQVEDTTSNETTNTESTNTAEDNTKTNQTAGNTVSE